MRESTIVIRVNNEEKALFEKVAEKQGLKTGSWARRELLRSARQPTDSNGHRKAETRALPLLSLFCGPGGLDEGFKQAGFHTSLAFDIYPEAVNTFSINHPETIARVKSVTELSIPEMDEALSHVFKPVGVIGGPPCQSFSVSNVHQKDEDPRHLLPEAYASLLKRLNKRSPLSFFVFENVPGLLGVKHQHRYDRFKRMFRDAGFKITEALLDAQDYGVPQERKRVIIVGINQELHPGREWAPPPPEKKKRTVRDTISDLPEPVYNEPGLDPDTFPVHPNHWCLVPRSAKFERKMLEEGQMWGRSFRTLWWDQPSWTVAYGHREVHVHPNGHRRLSIYEAMLLQTFPQHYRLTGNMSAQIRLVSEAVPPRLAMHIAQSIKECLNI